MSASSAPREWSLAALLRAAGIGAGPLPRGFDPRIDRLSVDSRDVAPGTCFVALAGSRDDGHAYVDQALARGASVAIVEAGRFPRPCPHALAVPSTREAVAKLAATFFGVDRLLGEGRLTLVGVTGTNGKTTVCTLLHSILQAAGRSARCFGTIDNDAPATSALSTMTTLPPIELCTRLAEAAAAGVTHAALEVSSHALDQSRCAGLDFSVAVFTNLTQDHLDYHPDMSSYAAAKKRLFDALRPSATAVIGADDPYAETMIARCAARVVRYGLPANQLDVRAANIALSFDETRFDLCFGERRVALVSRLRGRENLLNMCAAAGAADALGVALDKIKEGIEAVKVIRGRMQRVEAAAPYAVLVDYSHTPEALRGALAFLGRTTAGRVICVFGCGGDRDSGKRPLMGRVVAKLADVAVVTNDNPRTEDPTSIIAQTLAGFSRADRCAVVTEPDRARAIRRAVAMARAGDAVLIAGKGHEDYQIIGRQRRWFDDEVVAREAMARTLEVSS